jgi:Fur family ferric uptake transcriptional regulator
MHLAPQPPNLDEQGVERGLQQLRAVTHEKGLKNSAVREAVARAALSRTGHFSVEDLAADLKQGGPKKPHSATVYRVLPILVEAGLVQETLVTRGEGTFYERAFEREHHDHLICTSCGTVVEFHSEAIETLQNDLAVAFGFRLTDHVHELLGLCSDCDGRSS